MPSYFYHLKFELYPYPSSPTSNSSAGEPANSSSNIHSSAQTTKTTYASQARRTTKEEEEEEVARRREIYVPPEGADIWDNSSWPVHGLGSASVAVRKRADAKNWSSRGSVSGTGTGESGGAGQGVIDCGPGRVGEEGQDAIRGNLLGFGFEGASRDWRFGRVRVESLDLGLTPSAGKEGDMDTHTRAHAPILRRRGESSSAGVGAGALTAGTNPVGGGRVTKARFDALESKNTELGWGVVHLYRDGEESVGLGSPVQEEIYSADDNENGEGAEEDYTVLCIPAVPSYLTSSDFLGFVGEKTREQVSHFRMVMTGKMNRYLVLMKFRDGGVARKWRREFDGKVFNSMEPETCHVMFIKSITFQSSASSHPNTSFPELSHDPFTPSTSASTFLKPFPPPTPNLVELPTCPVCLERMDDTTGLLTILCQHVFHCSCLQKWKGSGCPVCRHTNPSLTSLAPSTPYDPSNPPFGSGEASLCSICDSTDDLWICLICGNVGCGRYKGGHAKEHWKDSAHNFALEIETQHVWDYAGDMWVHRLIRDKGDSKVIELPSSSRRRDRGGERGEEMDMDMDMVPREKLERIGIEYTHLLTSQLESQRVYFEELVGKAVAKASAASSAAAIATSRADEAVSQFQSLSLENKKLKEEVISSLEKDLEREKRKAEKSGEVARAFGKSLREEKKVSEGLMERVQFLNERMAGVEGEVDKVKEENRELRDENRDLLFSVSAGERIREMGGEEGEGGLERGELEGGSLSLPPPPPVDKGKGKRKGKK